MSYSSLLFHVVFSTKERRPLIEEGIRRSFFAYMGGIVRELGGKAFMVNGMSDHVHLLLSLPPTISVAHAMRVIKANSSRWIHKKRPGKRSFSWQDGYAVFTVSQSNLRRVFEYIENQEAHHRRRSFREELVALLKRHEVPFDERYLTG